MLRLLNSEILLTLNVLWFETTCPEVVNVTLLKGNYFKYIGITLDWKLKWDKHIYNTNKEIKISARKNYYLINICGITLLKMLYLA